MHGHSSSSAIPVTIPAPSAVSPQASRSITAQTSSSGSSDAEVAELAGASIEESTEIKRRAEQQQQVMPGRAADELSDQWPSTEEDDDAEGNKN